MLNPACERGDRVARRLVLLLVVTATACGDGGKSATADLVAVTGQVMRGKAAFEQRAREVVVTITVENAPPGQLGVHIHDGSSCGSLGLDAGPHWNPTRMRHGGAGSTERHAGDIGNLLVGPDGKGSLPAPHGTDKWSIGTGDPLTDIVGKTVVVHERRDDGVTQTAGDAGSPIGCGPIRAGE